VRQGCIISPILFLVAVDWVMRQTPADKPRGIPWTPFTYIEDLDFADDVAALCTNTTHLQKKTDRLNKFSNQAGLNISTSKSKVMSICSTTNSQIIVNSEPLEQVDDFTYLGSIISKDNAAQKDIQARLGKTRGAFVRLKSIWKSTQYSTGTKIKLYNIVVKPVLLYGSECWRVTQNDMKKISVFHNRCLRRICRIFWPMKVSNTELFRRSKSQDSVLEIRRRRLRWLGHPLRMNVNRTLKIALRWTPPGKRKQGRSKNIWRRTITSELKEMGISWDEAQRIASDRVQWRQNVDALCPTRDKENM